MIRILFICHGNIQKKTPGISRAGVYSYPSSSSTAC